MKVDPYLKEIDVPAALRRRIGRLLELYEVVLTEPIETLFLSDEIDSDANRTFPSLWLFTKSAAYEAKVGGESEEEFDGTSFDGRMFHWVVRTAEFDLKRANSNSRMKLEIWFSDALWGDLRATGVNCERLTDVLVHQVAPRLRSRSKENS